MLTYLIHILIFILLTGWLWQSAKHSVLRPFFWIGMGLKIVAGLMLGWIYLRFYNQFDPVFPDTERLFFQGDSWSYFAHGQLMTELAPKDWNIYFDWLFQRDYAVYERFNRMNYNNNNRAVLMYRITHIFNFLTANNYWLISIYFSLFSFLGLWKCADMISRIFPYTKYALGIGFFLFPSVVFWSSGILKETLLVGCLGWVIAIVLTLNYFEQINKLSKFKILKYILMLTFCLWVILRLKYYYFAVFMPVLIAHEIAFYIGKRWKIKNWTQVSLFFGVLLVFLGLASFLHYNLNLSRVLEVIVQNYHDIFSITPVENQIHFIELNSDFQSFMVYAPKAFLEGFLRPYPWESGSLIKTPARIESIFLYLLLVSNFYFLIRQPKINLLLIATITFSGVLLVLMTFAMPNIGTLIRYKVGFMPFIIYILSIQPTLWLERKVNLFLSQ